MFLIIDMQNDFVDQERGRMVVKGADRLVNGIIEKIKKYEQKKDLIFYTLDIHKKLPGDNRLEKEKQWGQELYYPLKENLAKHISLEKYYYAISPKTSEEFKQKYGKEKCIETIEIVGVETNVCVLANAVIFRNMFPKSEIIINNKLCLSSVLDLHEKALDIMVGLNMKARV